MKTKNTIFLINNDVDLNLDQVRSERLIKVRSEHRHLNVLELVLNIVMYEL